MMRCDGCIPCLPQDSDQYKILNINQWTSYDVYDIENKTVNKVRIDCTVPREGSQEHVMTKNHCGLIERVMKGAVECKYLMSLGLILVEKYTMEDTRFTELVGNCPKCGKVGYVSMVCSSCTNV